jgi:hypothetical protein
VRLHFYHGIAVAFVGGSSPAYADVQLTTNSPSPIISIWGGAREAIALEQDGTVWSWGNNPAGELGKGSLTFEVRSCMEQWILQASVGRACRPTAARADLAGDGPLPGFYNKEAWHEVGFTSLDDFLHRFWEAYFASMDINRSCMPFRTLWPC